MNILDLMGDGIIGQLDTVEYLSDGTQLYKGIAERTPVCYAILPIRLNKGIDTDFMITIRKELITK